MGSLLFISDRFRRVFCVFIYLNQPYLAGLLYSQSLSSFYVKNAFYYAYPAFVISYLFFLFNTNRYKKPLSVLLRKGVKPGVGFPLKQFLPALEGIIRRILLHGIGAAIGTFLVSGALFINDLLSAVVQDFLGVLFPHGIKVSFSTGHSVHQQVSFL